VSGFTSGPTSHSIRCTASVLGTMRDVPNA
jgi:hypothetical protein